MRRIGVLIGLCFVLSHCGGESNRDGIGRTTAQPDAGRSADTPAERDAGTSENPATGSGEDDTDVDRSEPDDGSEPTASSSPAASMSASQLPSEGSPSLVEPDVCGPGGCIAADPMAQIKEPPAPALCGGVECAAGEACCIATGTCFDPGTDAAACEPPAPDDDVWGRKTCASNAHCEAFEYCQVDRLNLCRGSGHCHPITNCGGCSDGGSGSCRVCACDGNTYPNLQTACLSGANVVGASGAGCGETITVGAGGASGEGYTVTTCRSSEQCPPGESCCALTARCHPDNEPALCEPPPAGASKACTENMHCDENDYCDGEGCSGPGGCFPRDVDDCGVLLEPVCGCDGQTYTSAACASRSGVRVASEGECDD